MPANKEFEKLWHDAQGPAVYKRMLFVWFRNGWNAAREVAAQQLAEADAYRCPNCGCDLSVKICPDCRMPIDGGAA